MTPKPHPRPRPLALAYVRVSTAEQAEQGASLDAQRATLGGEAARRGWDLELVADEGVSGRSLNRPGLRAALARLDAGEADYLLAVRLDRVSRSVADFAGLVDRATRRGWGVVLLHPSLDMSEPAGRFTANVLASAAQYESELIGQRTREGLAQRRAEGVRLGRPVELPAITDARILRLRRRGLSHAAIAARLTVEGVPTARGGAAWQPSSVGAVLRRLGDPRRAAASA